MHAAVPFQLRNREESFLVDGVEKEKISECLRHLRIREIGVEKVRRYAPVGKEIIDSKLHACDEIWVGTAHQQRVGFLGSVCIDLDRWL